MISNQILQTTVDGLKAISRVDLCVIDSDGKIAAKTFDDVQGCVADALTFMDSPAESQVVNGYQFFKVIDEQNLEYILLYFLAFQTILEDHTILLSIQIPFLVYSQFLLLLYSIQSSTNSNLFLSSILEPPPSNLSNRSFLFGRFSWRFLT